MVSNLVWVGISIKVTTNLTYLTCVMYKFGEKYWNIIFNFCLIFVVFLKVGVWLLYIKTMRVMKIIHLMKDENRVKGSHGCSYAFNDLHILHH